MLTEVKSFVRGLQTIAVVLLWFLSTTVACANPIVLTPYESLPWLKLGNTRQSDVVRAIGQPAAVIDEVRFRSEMIDRRSDYKALGLMVWYLLDGEPDPKVNQVVFESSFKGQSSLGLTLGSKREEVISKLKGLYKVDEDEEDELDGPDFVMLDPLTSDSPKIDLWFTNGSLSQVRLTSFLPPSENANRDRARVAALVKRDNLQDGFIEVPRCEYMFIFNRKLKRLGQKRIVVADSNVNWRLELFENNQNGTWTLLGYSKDKLSSSHKACELAGGNIQGTTPSAYRAARWYQKYFQ